MRTLFILALATISSLAVAQEHVRIEEYNTTYILHDNQTAEIEEHYKVKILSEQGYKFSVYSQYYDEFQKITDVTVDVFDRDGKKVKRLRRNDGFEWGLSPSNEFTDITQLSIDPGYKQFPFTVEVNSKIKLDGFISLPTWVPRSEFHVAVDRSQLTVIRPASVKVNFREENIQGATQRNENKVVTVFKVSNLPHVDNKLRYKDFYDLQPKVLISPEKFQLEGKEGSATTWETFGDWFLSINNDPYKLAVKTREHIDRLEKSDKKKLVQDIYEYMQDRTRYISIQLGIGGFKSLPTEKVDNYGYGDCKALSTYMKSMLDYAGVKSNYVLVRAGDDVPDVIAEFPGNQFNHVYLGVPFSKDTILLECASQIVPVNYTGRFTDDRNVLWIENNTSSIIRSRTYNHEINKLTNFTGIKLDKEGNAETQIESFRQGIFFDDIMLFKSAPTDYVKSFNQSKFDYNDFVIKNFSYHQPKRNEPAFVAKYSLQVNGLAKFINEKLVLPIIPVTPFYRYFEKDDLKRFYSIKRGLCVTDIIEINLPQNYWIYNFPAPEKLNTAYGSYNLEVTAEGDKLKIKRTLILFKGDYNNSLYDEFKTFYQAIEKVEKRKLVLNSKT